MLWNRPAVCDYNKRKNQFKSYHSQRKLKENVLENYLFESFGDFKRSGKNLVSNIDLQLCYKLDKNFTQRLLSNKAIDKNNYSYKLRKSKKSSKEIQKEKEQCYKKKQTRKQNKQTLTIKQANKNENQLKKNNQTNKSKEEKKCWEAHVCLNFFLSLTAALTLRKSSR